MQIPTAPATLHASQVPEQAALQHEPSTQYPLPHWLADVHDVPLEPMHVPRCEGLLHTSPEGQVVAPVGLDAGRLQQTPSTHWSPVPHDAVALQVVPRPARGTHFPPLQ